MECLVLDGRAGKDTIGTGIPLSGTNDNQQRFGTVGQKQDTLN